MRQRLPISYDDMTKEQLAAYSRANYQKDIVHNRTRKAADAKARRQTEQGRRLKRMAHARNRYKLTNSQILEFDKITNCQICGSQFSATILSDKVKDRSCRTPNIDHDHVSGKARGVVCAPCNLEIGRYEKLVRSGMLEKLLAYLKPEAS